MLMWQQICASFYFTYTSNSVKKTELAKKKKRKKKDMLKVGSPEPLGAKRCSLSL